MSNCSSCVPSSLLNCILFVPLGAEGPVNCLQLFLHAQWQALIWANPSAALATRMMRPLSAAALFTEQQISPLKLRQAPSSWEWSAAERAHLVLCLPPLFSTPSIVPSLSSRAFNQLDGITASLLLEFLVPRSMSVKMGRNILDLHFCNFNIHLLIFC